VSAPLTRAQHQTQPHLSKVHHPAAGDGRHAHGRAVLVGCHLLAAQQEGGGEDGGACTAAAGCEVAVQHALRRRRRSTVDGRFGAHQLRRHDVADAGKHAAAGDSSDARRRSRALHRLGALRVLRVVAHVQVRHTCSDGSLQHRAARLALKRASRVHHQVCALERCCQRRRVLHVTRHEARGAQRRLSRRRRLEARRVAAGEGERKRRAAARQRDSGAAAHAAGAANNHHARHASLARAARSSRLRHAAARRARAGGAWPASERRSLQAAEAHRARASCPAAAGACNGVRSAAVVSTAKSSAPDGREEASG
jgi:hypothetical protein